MHSYRKAGAKVRTLPHNFQMFSEVFFFFLFDCRILGWNKHKRREICWSSVSVSVRMSIARLTVSWKAGAKVVDITIQSKYIYHFFTGFQKLIHKTLIDKDVVEHIFKKERGRARKGTHYIYTYARGRRKGYEGDSNIVAARDYTKIIRYKLGVNSVQIRLKR